MAEVFELAEIFDSTLTEYWFLCNKASRLENAAIREFQHFWKF